MGFKKVLLCFFFNIVLKWKIVGVSEVSVIYIYIDNIFSFTNTTTIVGIFANSQLLKKI